jgi:hypothetical protein
VSLLVEEVPSRGGFLKVDTPHRHTLVSGIQAMSQKRLNGSPSTRGYTRSHSGTAKQIARKGTEASRKDRTFLLFISV